MTRLRTVALAVFAGLVWAPSSAFATDGGGASDTALPIVAKRVAVQACTSIASRVDAIGGDAPVLLRSYDGRAGSGEANEPALRTAAFSYDNALAVIALLACDKQAEASRIGAALERAVSSGPRLRNTYRAGAVAADVLPNGWWDAAQNRWLEDPYQNGSATGNVAWVGLALLALYDATAAVHWRDAAATLATWVVANTEDTQGAGGFRGGVDGFDAAPTPLTWKSTEHAIDLSALFARLADAGAAGAWRSEAEHARRFVDLQWDPASGHFLIGTLPYGVTPNRTASVLDVQLWSQLLADAKPDWRRAVAYAERVHAVDAGFDFNDDRDGVWLEGTAQAALVYRVIGRPDAARRALGLIATQFSSGGYVYATREAQISTGLAIGSTSTSADFHYYRQPHLGATAWAALAALDRNPYRAQH